MEQSPYKVEPSPDEVKLHRIGVKWSALCLHVTNKQRVLMHRHQGWNVRHGLCHIYMRYVYVWVVYSLCFICCLFITVTWWYVWCIEWASSNQEEVQACLVTLLTCAPRRSIVLQFFWHVDTRPISPFLFFFNSTVCYAHDLKIIHIFINTQWIFMFNVSIEIIFLWEIWLK